MTSAVLIVEDEKHLADGLRFNLEAEDYRVTTVGDGEAALALLIGQPHDFEAVILDVMLPGSDGFAVARMLRRAGEFVPVLMLTARGRPEDVLLGFEAGADDYLPKPFELSILLARLRGLLRRREWLRRDAVHSNDGDLEETPTAATTTAAASTTTTTASAAAPTFADNQFSLGDRTIDFNTLEIRFGGGGGGRATVRLTLMEAELLRYLIGRAGRIVSRKQILEDVWGLHEDTDTRAIDNFIVRLRRYLEDEPSQPKHLLTVRGVGYRFGVAGG